MPRYVTSASTTTMTSAVLSEDAISATRRCPPAKRPMNPSAMSPIQSRMSMSSCALRCNQTHSDALRRTQTHSATLSHDESPCHTLRRVGPRCAAHLLNEIDESDSSGHQWSSVVISAAHLLNEIEAVRSTRDAKRDADGH